MPVEQGVSKPLHPNIIIIQRVVNRVFFNCKRNYVTSTARSVIADINNTDFFWFWEAMIPIL